MRWDRGLIEEGQAIARRCLRRNQPGTYQLQAAINAVHADAATPEETDWSQIVTLYDQLFVTAPTPVVARTAPSRSVRCTVLVLRWPWWTIWILMATTPSTPREPICFRAWIDTTRLRLPMSGQLRWRQLSLSETS